MNRLVIFAHYDKDNIIDDYVIYYLNQLKLSFNKIIFVSDSDLSKKELSKLDGIADYIQAYHHNEYDWGSYKFGFKIALDNNLLENTDELLLCNDSVYGPINSLEPYFDKMSKSESDFFGMFMNEFGLGVWDEKSGKYKEAQQPHLQSWFLLLKKNVFTSDLFKNFIFSVKHFDNKNDIINNYEIAFTEIMKKEFKYSYFYTSPNSNSVVNAAQKMLKEGFPFIKTSLIKRFGLMGGVFKINNSILNIHIKNNLKRYNSVNIIRLFFRIIKYLRRSSNVIIIKNI